MIFITGDLHGHHDITSMTSRKTLKFLLMFVFAMITVSIQWLYESGYETAFRKELTNYDRDEVVMEMQHLKEYLGILL